MGEDLPPEGFAAVAQAEEREAPWLGWCRWWAAGREDEPPFADWPEVHGTWGAVRQGALLLSSTADAAVLAAFGRQTDRWAGCEGPLAHLRRLLWLEALHRFVKESAAAEAASVLAAESIDSPWAAAVIWPVEAGERDMDLLGPRARFYAYRARRLAERLENVGLRRAATRWRRAAAVWAALAARGVRG
jgi:hypothetical protein